jgi:hypothetical protein
MVKVLSNAGEEVPRELFLGSSPQQTADNVSSVTTPAAPAATGLMYGSPDVPVGAGDPTIQSMLRLRQVLAGDAEFYYNNGRIAEAAALEQQVSAIDLGLYKSQAEQGIYEMRLFGDPSRAMSVLSQFTGVPTQALARGDGTFDIYTNGRVSQTAVPTDELADLVKTRVDAGYREQKAAFSAMSAEKEIELRNKIAEIVAKSQGDIQLALVQGELKILEREYDVDIKVDANGGIAYVRKGNVIGVLTPGEITQVRGQEIMTPPTFIPAQ